MAAHLVVWENEIHGGLDLQIGRDYWVQVIANHDGNLAVLAHQKNSVG